MKFFKLGEQGKEKCGVVINNELYSAARLFKDYDEKFFENDGLSIELGIDGLGEQKQVAKNWSK
jgi:hypothetical protein